MVQTVLMHDVYANVILDDEPKYLVMIRYWRQAVLQIWSKQSDRVKCKNKCSAQYRARRCETRETCINAF